MRRLLIATMTLAGTVGSGLAEEVWQGDLFITAASTACVSKGWNVNDFMRSVYKPRNLEDNGVDTKLSIVASRNAQRYLITNAPLAGAGNYSAMEIGSTANVFTWNGTYTGASVTPASPTVNTPTVVIKVTIKTFSDIAGCNLTLQGSLGNRPNL